MKPATRKTSAANSLPAQLLIVMISAVAVGVASAGDHHIGSAAQQVSGCIDGNCGVPMGPFGHYQGSWRRWPFAQDSTMNSNVNQGSAAREPFIPDAIDEGRTRLRTRSDRPMDPKDMAGAGVGSISPSVPDARNEANPFNNTVDDSDMLNNGGGQPAGNEPAFSAPDFGAPPAPADAEPLFETPAAGGLDAEPPSTDADSEPDFFNFNSSAPPAPPNQQNVRQMGAIRSIKNRGVQLHTGMAVLNRRALPAEVKGLEISLPVEDSVGGRFAERRDDIGLVSFDEFETKSQPPMQREQRQQEKPSPKKLSHKQVVDSVGLPNGKVDASQSTPEANEDAEMLTNPLRRGSPVRRRKPKVAKSSVTTHAAPQQESETLELPTDETNAESFDPSTVMTNDSRVLNNAVASRTQRKNPFRR